MRSRVKKPLGVTYMRPNSLYPVAAIFALILTASPAWADRVVTTQSGHTYVYTNDIWCLAVDGDSVLADTTCISVHKEDSGPLTEQDLDAAGFPDANIFGSLYSGYHILNIPDTVDAIAYISALESSSLFDWARFDVRANLFSMPNDSLFADQWGFGNSVTSTVDAWDIQKGTTLPIAIIDSGVDKDHEDIQNISNASTIISTDPLFGGFADPNGHGTAVSGIIGALTNNNIGVAGVAV